MSLLMDALRKAEESKKKAEQGNLSPDESKQTEAAPDSGQAPAEDTNPGEPLAQTPMSETDTGPVAGMETPAGKFDVPIEFDETEEALTQPAEQPAEIELELEIGPAPAAESGPGPEPQPEPESEPVIEIAAPELDGFEEEKEAEKKDEELQLASDSAVPGDPKPVAEVGPAAALRIEQPPVQLGPESEQPSIQHRAALHEERRAASSVFAAKRSWQKNRRNSQLAVMGVAAVLVIGVGSYFYINLSAPSGIGVNVDSGLVSQNSLTPPMPEPQVVAEPQAEDLTSPTAAPLEPGAQSPANELSNQTIVQVIGTDGAAPQVAADAEPISEEPSAPTEVEPALTPTPASNMPVTIIDTGPVIAPPGNTATATNPTIESTAIAAEPQARISFLRRSAGPVMPQNLDAAYTAYSRGEMEQARQLYQQVLVDEPLNRDSLLGIAAISIAENNRTEAVEVFSRLLARDPSDPVARAGLLGLLPNGSLADQERELRSLLERHPAVAAIAFALGNFYASQRRWSNAQQYYFNALSLAKNSTSGGRHVNPDYAFNLAVSLEHLNQIEPARSYYLEALQLATSHPASFDLGIARSRLDNLNRAVDQ